jgi:hypothetical protein
MAGHKLYPFHDPEGTKTYNLVPAECVQVKEEDLDWWIYHLLADEPGQDIIALSGKTGCSTGEVASSLDRLGKLLLIERFDEGYRISSIQEMLLTCQSRYDDTSSFIIENGIIRERKRPE